MRKTIYVVTKSIKYTVGKDIQSSSQLVYFGSYKKYRFKDQCEYLMKEKRRDQLNVFLQKFPSFNEKTEKMDFSRFQYEGLNLRSCTMELLEHQQLVCLEEIEILVIKWL